MATVSRSAMAPLAGLMLLLVGSKLWHCAAERSLNSSGQFLKLIATNASYQKYLAEKFPCVDTHIYTCPEGLLTNRNGCSCHSHCHLFGRCCNNTAPGNGAGNKVRPYAPESYVCYSSPGPKADAGAFHLGVYMVNSCPNGSEDRITRLCKHPLDGPHETDAVSTPVSDPISGVTYRNVHCADCNGRPLDELAYWRWKYTCPDKGKHSQRLREWTKTEQPASVVRRWILDHTRSRCQLSYLLPQDTNLQRCFVNLVDDCADNAFDSILYRKQRSRCRDEPFDIVHTRDGKRAFKNRHCATCSFVQMQSLSCWRLSGISFVNHRESFTIDAIFGLGGRHCDERVATPKFESRDAYCEAEAACTEEKMNEDICIINYYIAKSIWASLDEVSPDRTTNIAARPSHMQYAKFSVNSSATSLLYTTVTAMTACKVVLSSIAAPALT